MKDGMLALRVVVVMATVAWLWADAREARAQFNANQFGGADRAAAAQQMIILGVQQGISSLPPTSGQSFEYEYDTSLGVMVPTETLGPTAFRSAQTAAPGKFNLRGAFSYFSISQHFAPIQYLAEFQEPIAAGLQPAGIVGFGLDASARVSVFNLSTTYGITDRVEFEFTLPIVIVNAHAAQLSSTRVSTAGLPTSEASLSGIFQGEPLSTDPQTRQAEIDALSSVYDEALAPPDGPCTISPEDCLTYRSDSFGPKPEGLGFNFNEGTNVGIGRLDFGAKGLIYGGGNDSIFDLAGSLEFFLPSPNPDQFAGSSTASVLPRLIGQARLHPNFRLHSDVGYDLDFSESTLRRFVWDLGASVPVQHFDFDFGFGGSLYDTSINWTPRTATGIFSGPTTSGQTIALTALGDTGLGKNFVDFLFGLKYQVLEHTMLTGAVNVPINDQGFRPAAAGTAAVEVYF